MAGRALWFIPSGRRRMPAVWDWIDRTDYVDKLILHNFQKDTADEIAMQFFFAREEYDHFIISTDDVMGHPNHVQMLLDDEEEHGFPIISGWCNHLQLWASLRINPMSPEFIKEVLSRPAPGLDLRDYAFVLSRDVVTGSHGYPFLESWFTGIPLTLIRKETLREVPFREFRRAHDKWCLTPEAKKEGRGVMQDLQWAIDCEAKGIPVTTDVRIFLLHVFNTKFLMTMGEPQKAEFIPAKIFDGYHTQADLQGIEDLLAEITVSAEKERKLTKNYFIE